jgi:hypothetical protein
VAVDGVGKAAQNLRRYHDSAPVRVATAFGTLAWGAQYANFLKDMQTILGPGVAAGKTVYSYPDDAWLYLVLPADNPLPFTSLVRNYNTPAQFRLVCDAIERGVPDYVVVNRLFGMRDDDPVVAALARGYTKVAIRPFSDVYGRGTSAPTGR